MAWRAISDNIGRSESLAALSDLAERIFFRLVAHSDPYGRLPGSPPKLRATCFPLLGCTQDDVGRALCELERVNRIVAYEIDGQEVIQLVGFDENQPKEFIRRRGDTRLPSPKTKTSDEHSRAVYKLPAKRRHSRKPPEQSRKLPESSGVVPPQEKRKKERTKPSSSSTTTRARNPEPAAQPDAAAAEDVVGQIEDLGLNGQAIHLAQAEPARAQAWLKLASAEAQKNPAGYVLAGLKSGEWPSPRATARRAANPLKRAEVLLKNLASAGADRRDLERELDDLGITETSQRERLLAKSLPDEAAA